MISVDMVVVQETVMFRCEWWITSTSALQGASGLVCLTATSKLGPSL